MDDRHETRLFVVTDPHGGRYGISVPMEVVRSIMAEQREWDANICDDEADRLANVARQFSNEGKPGGANRLYAQASSARSAARFIRTAPEEEHDDRG